jgi:hypothetical protein
LHWDHNKATAAARPPSTPAPKPATFCGLAFFVADAAADDELETWLETLAATEEAEEDFDETADETDEDALDAEEALDSAEDTLEVTDAATEEEVEEGAEEAVEEAVEAQETAVGRSVTPEILQKFWAYEVAACWSAGEHFPARQHAIPLKKFLFSQIHAISMLLHPPIDDPLVNWVTHSVFGGISMAFAQ